MKIFSVNKGLRVLFYSLVLATLPLSALARAHASPSREAYFQQLISGTVSDGTGPLPGATVVVKGSGRSAVTDADGKFSIAAAPEDVLIVSFVGFKSVEMLVGAQAVVNIILVEDSLQLEEVTINAGYYNVKQKESTGNISRITSKDIETQPVSNVLATMQGRMAGVSITQDSGAPGGAFQIRIRGQNSLRSEGNDPLYIIDGVPFSSETIGFSETSGFNPSMTSPLNGINPANIASIEVLKDADATAIYGSRGANGVVLITTKKGRAGKTAVSVTASTSAGKVTTMLDLMKTGQYLAMRRQAYANDGITTYPDSAYDVNGTWDQNRYTDWQKELIGGTAQITTLQASVSGGSESTQYQLSGDYRTETTVMPGDFSYDRGSVHFNVNHGAPDDRFKLTFSSGYSFQKNDLPATDLTTISRSLAPNAPALYNPDGSLNWENNTWTNPLAALEQQFTANINTLTASTVLSYAVTPSLLFKANLGYNEVANSESKATPSTMYNPSFGFGSESSSIELNKTGRKSWIIEPQVSWSGNWSKGKIEALAGATFQRQQTDRLFQFGYGFPSNTLINNLAAASFVYVYADDITIYKYQALFARVNYNWDGRYIINLTGRRDGSSRFGPGNQFANFGAVGAAWLFSNENFLKDSKVLSFGKIRGSYGTTGNDQIGDYQYYNTYATNGVTYDGIVGLQPTKLYNPNFGWEVNRKLEAGLELGFFKDRVFATASWYRNRSSNQLVGIPLPGTTGFSVLTANLDAKVENSGLEFTLRTINIDNGSFSWSTSFNIAANRNKLIAYPGLETSPYATTYRIGQSLNIINLYQYNGVDPQTGHYAFTDFNGDDAISYLDDRKAMVDLTPSFFGGLQNQLQYKAFSLDFIFHFVKQDNLAPTPGALGTAVNQRADITNVWNQPGDQAAYQRFTAGFDSAAMLAFSQFNSSTGAVQDASFIRLKNVALSYDVPASFLKGTKLRLFATGQNVFTLTSYKNGDPELRFGGSLPPLRVFTGGVQLSF